MPIVQTVNSYHEFREAFRAYNRLNQFTNLEWLFDHIEEMHSDDTYELDVVALCCEFTESTFDEVARDYAITLPEIEEFMATDDEGHFYNGFATEYEKVDHEEAKREAILEYLNYNTTVVNYDNATVMFVVF